MLWIICCIEKLYIVSKSENGSQCGTALNQYCLLWQKSREIPVLRTLGKYQMIYQSIGFLGIYYKHWILYVRMSESFQNTSAQW